MGTTTTDDTALLIEHDPDRAAALEALLGSAGFAVVRAEDGAAALQAAWTEHPDLVVADVHAPKLNGYQVCRVLKSNTRTARIPVVIVTSLDERIDRFWAEQCGASRLVNRDDVADDLLPSVGEAIMRRDLAGEPTSASRTGDPGTLSAEVLDRILLDQTIALRFHPILTESKGPDEALREVEVLLDNLLEFHEIEIDIHLPSGTVRHFERQPRKDPEEYTWRKDLENEGSYLGSFALRLRRAPDARTARILEVVGDELRNVARHLVQTDRTAVLESEIQHGLRLRSVGQLASQLAHEMNTPAQYALDCIRFVAESIAPLAPVLGRLAEAGNLPPEAAELELDYLATELPQALADAESGVSQIAGIVRTMRDLSPLADAEKSEVDVQEVLEDAILLSAPTWEPHADILLDLDESPRDGTSTNTVLAAPGDLQQVVVQILANAVEAIERKGEAKGSIRIWQRTDDAGIHMEIVDNGTGMSTEIRERVFEPFFTTKTAGGMGHGLALVHAIVCDRCRGRIECESREGEGTTFRLWFPRAENEQGV